MKNFIKKIRTTDHGLRTTIFCLMLTAFCSLTGIADPLDSTYRQTFHLSPLIYPTLVTGKINNVFDYRNELLEMTSGVMPTNVKLGASFGVDPLQHTTDDYYDYIFAQNYMANGFEACFVSDTPLGTHINATPWGDSSNQPSKILYNFLEKYDGGTFVQQDRFGRIRVSSKPQTPEANEGMAGAFFGALEMQLTLSRNATLVQDYFRRNNRMLARQQKWYREQHPDIVIFASMSSEYQQNNHANSEYCDYSIWTKQEFRDWLSGVGFYVGDAQYASLATFNSAFGFSFSSWDDVDPPTTVNWGGGSYWNKWQEFRVEQIRNMEQEQVNWTIDGGLTPDQVYGHQTPFNPATTDDSQRKHAGFWTTTFVDEGGNGITTYNEACWDPVLFSAQRANDKSWGIFEYNPARNTFSLNRNALEAVWDYDAHVNCPNGWANKPPLGIKDTVFETAIQDFFLDHFADSFTGLKTYEADPSGNDVIWTMTYESDIENSADISSVKFTNGVMSANVNGTTPYITFDLDESKHYLESDRYYTASFRIFTTNSFGNSGKFLWHENGGSNHEINFSLKNGWNTYKVNLMESASWQEKNIDDLKLFLGAENNSKIKIDWFRLEANHCWHFGETGEIYGQNQLSGETFFGSEFFATTTGADGYFYLSTDKQAAGEHADRAFINSKFYKKIRVKMTSSISGTGQIHWWQRNGTHDFKDFAVASGTQTYEIDMTDEANWTNSITIFRIDPINQSGADFSIEYVNVSPEMLPPRIANSDIIVNSCSPVFLWENPTEPDYSGVTYSLQIATDFDFNNIVFSVDNLTDEKYTYIEPTILKGLHWWRIRAKADDGTLSPWAVPMSICPRTWTFDSTNDIISPGGITAPEIIDGEFMRVITTNGDPGFQFRTGRDRGVNTEVYKKFRLRMRLNPPTENSHACEFFMMTGEAAYKETFSFPRDGEWHDIELDLSENSGWNENDYMKYIRLDPAVGGSGYTVDVDVAYFLPDRTKPAAAEFDDEIFSYIQNSDVRLGVITNYGAIIGFFSEISTDENFVNYMGAGRGIQQSYYGNTPTNIGAWKWNPVQGGNFTNAKPKLLVFSNENNKIYAKLNPRNWVSGELQTDVVMEEWIELTDNVAKITFKMSYTGTTEHFLENQEIPSAFFNSINNKLTYYNGAMAWTNGTLANFLPTETLSQDTRQEPWAAFVRDSGHGVGIYTPDYGLMDYYRIDGNSGSKSKACSQISAINKFAITNNFSCQFDVYLAIGMANEMRETFDNIRKSRFKYEPMTPVKNNNFDSDYSDWGTAGVGYGITVGGTSPIAGNNAWFNDSSAEIHQTLSGTKLQPNTTYELIFDAYSLGSLQTLKAGIMHGNNNVLIAPVHNTNVENFVMSSGSWNGNDWAAGGQFNTVLNPPANDPESTHALVFETPSDNIIGNNLFEDLTINIWDPSGVQIRLDNVSATNYPRDRSNPMPVLNNDFGSGATDWNNYGVGITYGGISPVTGSNAFFNSDIWTLTQILPGMKLKSNTTYQINFDSYSVAAEQPFKVALVHGRYSGNSSRFLSPIDDANVDNINVQDTTLASLGSGWLCGVTVTNILNPSADAPEISHVFTFDTPEILSGDKLAFDLGIRFWDAGGVQIRLDNVLVTNFPVIPEPISVISCLLSVIGIFFTLRKNKLFATNNFFEYKK